MPHLVDPVIAASAVVGMPQPRLVDAALLLRPWTTADVTTLRKVHDDPDIQRWTLLRLDSDDEAREHIERWAASWAAKHGASWAVTGRDEQGLPVGQVGFRSLYLADGLAELSYWTAPSARDRRVATRAVAILAEWALDSLGLVRLEIVHSVHNTASCGVAVRSGFRLEGTLRQLQQYQDGFHDMHLHSRVRDDARSAVR